MMSLTNPVSAKAGQLHMEEQVTDFGSALRTLRKARSWRQMDLVHALGDAVARSTIANIEAEREPPSERFWQLITHHIPEWVDELSGPYHDARSGQTRNPANEAAAVATVTDAGTDDRDAEAPGSHPVLGGPFVIERLTLIYTFRHSRAPEEIIEIRRVRASKHGADRYGLKLAQLESAKFSVDEEVLFGGQLATTSYHRPEEQTIYLRTIRFGRRLRRGQRHEFAVRSWIEADPEPGTAVQIDLTVPVHEVAIHLNFRGPQRPQAVWTYGPIADPSLTPSSQQYATPAALGPDGLASMYLTNPQTGPTYGIAWQWITEGGG
jgi:DNA-binding XRE family transcriptional regulator